MTYLGHRGSEDYNLVQLAYPLHEIIHTWSLYHVHIVVLPFNLHRNSEVRLVQDLSLLAREKILYRSPLP